MADGAGRGLPSSNRGVSEFRKPEPIAAISVGIDWIAMSVSLLAILQDRGHDDCANETLPTDLNEAQAKEYAHTLAAHFLAGTGIFPAEEAGRGRFYQWRVPLHAADAQYVGLVEVGGPNTVRKDGTVTARLELTGDGCRLYGAAGSGHAKRWLELRAKLESCAGRITRCDVAADDLQGQFPIRLAIQWREQGLFDARGQTPKARLYDDFDSGDGKTLYIGSSSSEKQLRIYEKGRELGDKESPWVRFECQFKASNRKELPLDMLRDPAGYLLGAYPVLSFINALASRIDVTDAAATATLKSARRHLKRQYGGTIHFLIRNTEGPEDFYRVAQSLASTKLPKWASNESGATSWPEIVAITTAKGQTT